MGYRELGILSIGILWVALAILLVKWRGHKGMSISLHGASAKAAYILFASILVIHGILFHIFLLQWFIPQHNLPISFIVLVNVTMICLYLTAIVPDTPGILSKIHRIAAYSMAFLMWVITTHIEISTKLELPVYILSIVTNAYMLYCMLGLAFLRRKHIKSYFLPYQAIYIILFQLVILGATYLN